MGRRRLDQTEQVVAWLLDKRWRRVVCGQIERQLPIEHVPWPAVCRVRAVVEEGRQRDSVVRPVVDAAAACRPKARQQLCRLPSTRSLPPVLGAVDAAGQARVNEARAKICSVDPVGVHDIGVLRRARHRFLMVHAQAATREHSMS